MDVISHFWKELIQGVHLGLSTFGAIMSREAKGEREHAFSVCQKLLHAELSDEQTGVA